MRHRIHGSTGFLQCGEQLLTLAGAPRSCFVHCAFCRESGTACIAVKNKEQERPGRSSLGKPENSLAIFESRAKRHRPTGEPSRRPRVPEDPALGIFAHTILVHILIGMLIRHQPAPAISLRACDVVRRPMCRKCAERTRIHVHGIERESRGADPVAARQNSQLKPP